MGWLIALAIIVLIAVLPMGLRFLYDEDGFVLRLMVGPFRFRLFPGKEDAGQQKKKHKKKTEDERVGGSIKDFIPFVQSVLMFLDVLRRKVRIRNLKMHLVFGGPDPADVAIQYGRGWAVLGTIFPMVEEVFTIRKRDLRIDCDFDADQTTLTASASITIMLWRLVYILVRYGYAALKQYQNLKKSKKAVEKNESKSS